MKNKTTTINIGSLFSGIGGLELGLEVALNAETIWQIERDLFCQSVLKRHWPKAVRYDDVTTARNLPYVDVMCGGFPCQDISLAGKRAGITGERSGLWKEFLRIIGECRPRVVVIENVGALISDGLSVVTSDLYEYRYDCTWSIVSAASVGAPHRRRRVFIVAANSDSIDIRKLQGWRHGAHWQRARISRHAREERMAANAARSVGEKQLRQSTANGAGRFPSGDCWRSSPPEVCRMDDGIQRRPHETNRRRKTPQEKEDDNRLKALGNAVVPACAEIAGYVAKELLE